jgi:hypothetical protein
MAKSRVGSATARETREQNLRVSVLQQRGACRHEHLAVRLAHRPKRAHRHRRLRKSEWHGAGYPAVTEAAIEAKGRGVGRRHRRERERHSDQPPSTGRTHAPTVSQARGSPVSKSQVLAKSEDLTMME